MSNHLLTVIKITADKTKIPKGPKEQIFTLEHAVREVDGV